MVLVSVFFLVLISLCNAIPPECNYDDEQKLLEIDCNDAKRANCTQDVPWLNSWDELNLKIEGCEPSFIDATCKEYPNIKRLDLSDSGHQVLNWTDHIFENLINFDASGNELTAIPTSILSKFPKLLTLRLDDNRIENINTGDFVSQHLSHLFLSNNKLKLIDDDAFANLNDLSEINLSKNKLSTYPVALSSKNNVRTVDLSENPTLKTIDCTFITSAKSTTNVSLTWKYITAFDGSCSEVPFVVKRGSFDQINNDYDHSELVCDNINQMNCFKNIQYFVAGPGAFKDVGDMVKLLGPSILKIDLSGNRIDEFKPFNFEPFRDLRELNLSDTGLDMISLRFLENQHNLTRLDISKNNLKEVYDAFANLNDLSEINLSKNQLSAYPVGLSSKNNVRIVDLSENSLRTIDCTFITSAKSTKHVLLTWQNVNAFDGSCSKVPFVVKRGSFDQIYNDYDHSELVCDNRNRMNCFRNIQYFVAGPGAFKNVSDMVKLLGPSTLKIDLSGNHIDEFKPTTFEPFRNLRELSLSDTGLDMISLRFLENQQNLNRLDISKNNLKEVVYPSKLQSFTQLIHFDASGNRIKNIDEVVRNLPTSIKSLDLSGNPIKASVLSDFERLPALTHLSLSDTHLPITDVEPFNKIHHLTTLDISNNDLSNVDFSKLQSLNRLKELRAANTQITNIPKIIQNLGPSVEKLDITGNPAAKFDSKLLDELKYSKTLDLHDIIVDDLDFSAGELQEIDVGQLPSSLKRLTLHGNNLKQINSLDREHFPAMEELDISDTELDCHAIEMLKLKFKDVHVIAYECFSMVLKIFLAILALFAIAIIILLCSLWISPKLCERKEPNLI